MIVITGAAGFIGSCLVARLNEAGYNDLILVDDFAPASTKSGISKEKDLRQKVERSEFHRLAAEGTSFRPVRLSHRRAYGSTEFKRSLMS